MIDRSARSSLSCTLSVVATILAGCGGGPPGAAPSSDAVFIDPPAARPFEPFELTFARADLQPGPVDASGVLVALAAGPAGIVAIGLEDGSVQRGLAMRTANGLAWQRADDPDLAGLDILDVASAGAGYHAFAVTRDDQRSVLLSSADGLAWTIEPADLPRVRTGTAGIAGGPAGLVLFGRTEGDESFLWLSTDGSPWDEQTAQARGIPEKATLRQAIAGPAGWLAVGSVGEPGDPTAALFSQGADTWTTTLLDPVAAARSTVARQLAITDGGWVVRGAETERCSDRGTDDCFLAPAGWWSADGVTWGRREPDESLRDEPDGVLVSGDPRGALVVTGRSTWASTDGWFWTPVGRFTTEGELDGGEVHAAIALDGRVVAVGAGQDAEARMIPFAGVGE